MPDTAILLYLANVLGTTVEFFMNGGERMIEYRGKANVADMIRGIKCIQKMGDLLGKVNVIYRSAIKDSMII